MGKSLQLEIKMRVATAICVAILSVGAALADPTKHDDPIKCYQTDSTHSDQLGNEVDCDSKTCLKQIPTNNSIPITRNCNPKHEDNERCDDLDGVKMCFCNSNLCNSSIRFKVNYAVIFGIL